MTVKTFCEDQEPFLLCCNLALERLAAAAPSPIPNRDREAWVCVVSQNAGSARDRAGRSEFATILSPGQEFVVVTISQIDFDHEREIAYRRGFVRGLSEAISGIAHKLSIDERAVVDGWLDSELKQWARASEPSCASPPPAFPRTGDKI